ncbi:non-ribosomal peptide synthetase [Cyanosarcina cf. burmensis CCALA 770]|nr:non-ribosomal peptide synthetase [Cyanosarcina cf. burmensis CCALA 770]
MNQQYSHLSPAKQALLEQWKGKQLSRQTIPKRSDRTPPPLSFSQQRLWFIDRYYGGSSFYNIPAALHLTGALNQVALQRSFAEIVRRHESWRTAFTQIDDRPVQQILPELIIEVPTIDLRLSQDWQTEVQQIAAAQTRKPFDLTQPPLFRASLLRICETEHVLLLIVHHIISDGWSMGVLMQEFATLYAAFSDNCPAPLTELLPELAVQYADFAIWQRDRLQGNIFNTQLTYWKEHLSGELPILQLPTDRPRPAIASFAGARYHFSLSAALTKRLHQSSQQQEVTLFMTLLAAFNVLLYRYTEQDDILVGTPVANRNRMELEKLLGCFVNTIVIRTHLQSDLTARDLLAQVREVTLGAYAHQDLPFEKLVEELQPERDLSRNPLFQVMFALQNAPMPARTVAGLKACPSNVDGDTAMFDLFLSVMEVQDGISGFLEYNTDLFDATTIVRFIEHYQTLLESFVTYPDCSISELPLLTASARQQTIADWNETRANYPHDATLHQLFERQVERSPHNPALFNDSETLTYEQLNRAADRLAHYLRSLGVTTGTPVAIYLDRSPRLVIGILAILKAGGAYVPLDPNYPSDRLAFMLSDSQASLILTQQSLLEKLPASSAVPICLDREIEQMPISQANLHSSVTADDPAYIIYTSGSTGTPKGVLGTHRGTANGLHWYWKTYPFAARERCCQKTAISFVDSVWEIFAPLLQGIPLILIPIEIVKDPQQFLETLAKYRVTRIILVPSLLRLLLQNYAHLTSKLSDLKIWITSGEELSADLVKTFRAVLPTVRLIDLYGSSEVSANVTYYDTHQLPDSASRVPIGRPIDNTQVYVLDRQLQPVPIGVLGELYVSGDSLAKGYWQRVEQTQERFIDHPFIANRKLYKTGDIVRYLSDGNLEYWGRRDLQVKLRGFRIELSEIEAAIAQHPAVQEAVVIARQTTQDDLRLIAYIIPTAVEEQEIVSQLHQALSPKLPDFMLPSGYVVLDRLPIAPSGKIDRRSLPLEATIRPTAISTHIAPRNPWELAIAHIWETLLQVKPISITDNFFELGGHSFLAVRLMAQIYERFGQTLPLSSLFEGATIERLAQQLQQRIGAGTGSPLVAIQTSGSNCPFFCIHPAGGTIVAYPKLAKYLGEDRPFYAIEQNPDLAEPEILSIEATAAHYLEYIRTVQPEGPYHIGGWCYGGVVAFEMAQQLHQQEQAVDLLVVMDAIAPETKIQTTADDSAKFIIRIAESAKYLFGMDVSISYQELLPLSPDDRFRLLMNRANITSDAEIQQHLRGYKLFNAHVRALRDYVPQPYPKNMTLFRAREALVYPFQSAEFSSSDPLLGWGKYTRRSIQAIDVPGNHFSMFAEPYVKDLGKKLKSILN